MPRKARKTHCKTFTRVRKQRRRVDVDVFAERLRKRMTKAETILWNRLQAVMSTWGEEFESQGVVEGRFIGDFVCRDKRLIIEVDGSIHNLARIKAKDKYRTMVLNNAGYTILRFNNLEVYHNCGLVLIRIRETLRVRACVRD